MYWDVFDELQHKLFVENKNIENIDVIEEAVKETDISLPDWKVQFEMEETEEAVLDDFQLVKKYGVRVVPTLVVNGKHSISGARSQEDIEEFLKKISDEEGIPLN